MLLSSLICLILARCSSSNLVYTEKFLPGNRSQSWVIFQEDKTLNAESTIAFLQKVEEEYPAKTAIHLFCDNARYYRNKAVQAYLKSSKIHLRFLPSYSPNLNPIERLWKFMKEKVMYNVYYEYFEDFKNAILGFLEQISRFDPQSLYGRMIGKRVRDHFRAIGGPLPET